MSAEKYSLSFISELLEGAKSAEPPINCGTFAASLFSTVPEDWRVAIAPSNR